MRPMHPNHSWFRIAAAAVWLGTVVALALPGGGTGCNPPVEGGGSTTGGTGSGTGTAGTAGGSTGGTAGTAGGTTGGTTGGAGAGALITFTPVGDSLSSELIDLAFLPGQGGQAIAIAKDGTVFYLKSDFTALTPTATITTLDSGEQGLLNVAADPDYASNHFIYLFYTLPDGSGNQVRRYTVSANVAGNTFSLTPGPVLATADKTAFAGTGDNHNGGSLVFDGTGHLYAGFGDGGGSLTGPNNDPDVSQDLSTNLGKVVRITNPAGGSPSVSIFAKGLRNPFTMTAGAGGIFIGDVGADFYEEIDFAPASLSNVNFGWNRTEGPTTASGVTPPIHGYQHGDTAFLDEDPDSTGDGGGEAIMAGAFYTGSQYGGALTNRFIYSEFYAAWVRSFALNSSTVTAAAVTGDQNIGHNPGMTSLQQGPDGFLYGVSLFNDAHILRVDLR